MQAISTKPIEAALPVSSGDADRKGGQNWPVGGSPLPPSGTDTDVLELAEALFEMFNTHNRNLTFRIDDTSGKTVVTVLDADTKEVIRQIPSEEFLRLVEVMESRGPHLLVTET